MARRTVGKGGGESKHAHVCIGGCGRIVGWEPERCWDCRQKQREKKAKR